MNSFPTAQCLWVLSILACLVSAGCNPGAPPSEVVAYFLDDDLSSGRVVGDGVRLGIEAAEGLDEGELVDQLRAAVDVLAPDGTPLMFTVSKVAWPSPLGALRFKISWEPEIESGWHLTTVDGSALSFPLVAPDVPTPDGGRSRSVRTSLGDNPVLSRVRFPLSGDTVENLTLVFSQPMRIAEGDALLDVIQLSDGVTGDVLSFEELAAPGPRVSEGAALRKWLIACDRYPETIVIRVHGPVTESGIPLRSLDGAEGRELRLSLASLEMRDGARVWAEPLQ